MINDPMCLAFNGNRPVITGVCGGVTGDGVRGHHGSRCGNSCGQNVSLSRRQSICVNPSFVYSISVWYLLIRLFH